jgi:hypothetical protein
MWAGKGVERRAYSGEEEKSLYALLLFKTGDVFVFVWVNLLGRDRALILCSYSRMPLRI